MKNDKTKHQYVGGFKGDIQCVYGKDRNKQAQWADPMTLRQATLAAKKVCCDGIYRIYRLVPIAEFRPKR